MLSFSLVLILCVRAIGPLRHGYFSGDAGEKIKSLVQEPHILTLTPRKPFRDFKEAGKKAAQRQISWKKKEKNNEII